jgi:hypothetical protein
MMKMLEAVTCMKRIVDCHFLIPAMYRQVVPTYTSRVWVGVQRYNSQGNTDRYSSKISEGYQRDITKTEFVSQHICKYDRIKSQG